LGLKFSVAYMSHEWAFCVSQKFQQFTPKSSSSINSFSTLLYTNFTV
jgi:hypothetical protein